ncbi:hypothetical protein B0E41_25080 [Hydrogenophaga sp. A37]|nr:hypothetical protein B0E41_25080 [Hydrogenophaga sp. A37]
MAGAAFAGVFKCKGPDGTVIFQDSACGPNTQSLQPAKADVGPAVNLSLPLAQRLKNPLDKRRLDAAIKISGMQMGLRKSLEHCQRNAPDQAAALQTLLNNWRSERASAISASERLIEKYLTMSERMDAFTKANEALSSIDLRASSDPAVNANNCKNAVTKIRTLLDTRYADVYAQVESGR